MFRISLTIIFSCSNSFHCVVQNRYSHFLIHQLIFQYKLLYTILLFIILLAPIIWRFLRFWVLILTLLMLNGTCYLFLFKRLNLLIRLIVFSFIQSDFVRLQNILIFFIMIYSFYTLCILLLHLIDIYIMVLVLVWYLLITLCVILLLVHPLVHFSNIII